MLTDNQLQLRVLAQLGWAPDVAAAQIGVSARDGIVTLSGQVASYAEKHAAETAARQVQGVAGVAENIEVLLPFDRQRTDSEIAAAAVDRLAWDVSIPRNALTVVVENGQVTISGDVEWRYERDAAEQDVRRLMGLSAWSTASRSSRRRPPNASATISPMPCIAHTSSIPKPLP